jgi:DNA-binding PadR family transcriptional regulator
LYSDILILAMLRQGPRHGYEIKKDVDKALGGMVVLNNKTLYRALKRFEETGTVTRQVVSQIGKPDRHVYELTEGGVRVMDRLLGDFGPEQARSDAEFFTRVSFFGFLDSQSRWAILNKRLEHLRDVLAYLDGLQQVAREDEHYANVVPFRSHAERVLAFHRKQVCDECKWIAGWLAELEPNAES